MWKDDVVCGVGRCGEEDEQEAQSDCSADELGDDERGHRGRCDAGESVAEDAADSHGGVRERRRGREPVCGADIGTHRWRGEDAPLGGGEGEDQQDEPRGCDDFAKQVATTGAVLDGDGGANLKHGVRDDAATDRTDRLRDHVDAHFGQGQARAAAVPQDPVHERDDGVEVRPADGPEYEDQYGQAQNGCGAVLQQLQANVGGRKLLRHDPRAHDDHHEQAGAEEFGDGTAPQRRLVCSHDSSLTQDTYSVKIESMKTDPAAAFQFRVAKHAALADPARLRIVDLLTLGDFSPTELQAELGMPSNLLSHHLRALEGAGLATRHRSEADKRRSYIRLAAGALEGLAPGAEHGATRILFVCTRNSARSQMAAALWRQVSEIPSTSAGTHPADRIAQGAIDVARRHGVELPVVPPRKLDGISGGDFVVTVCDNAHEELTSPGGIHWSVPDPLRINTDQAFEDAFTDISHRINDLAPRLHAA